MSEFMQGFVFGGVIVIVQLLVIYKLVMHTRTRSTTDAPPPPPSEGWTYTKSTNKPAKRPVPPKTEPRLRG